MMYTVKIRDEFSGAHNLRGYKGKCENLHGHNWKIEAEIAKKKLNNQGMVLDFKEMKKLLKEVLEKLDHTYLNGLPYFKKYNPTSENIAKYIYNLVKKDISDLTKVTVWESDSSCASYFKEKQNSVR